MVDGDHDHIVVKHGQADAFDIFREKQAHLPSAAFICVPGIGRPNIHLSGRSPCPLRQVSRAAGRRTPQRGLGAESDKVRTVARVSFHPARRPVMQLAALLAMMKYAATPLPEIKRRSHPATATATNKKGPKGAHE